MTGDIVTGDIMTGDILRAPVLFSDRPFPPEYLDLVEGRAVIVGPDETDLAFADAVIAGTRRWDGEAMDAGPRLKVISRTGIGYDSVDVIAAASRGIVVCNAPDAPTVSTAEHAVALILAVARDLPAMQERAVQGEGGAGANVEAVELAGSTVGLVGLGRIARRVARVAVAMEMTVLAHDPFLEASPVAGVELVTLDTLWARSDIISLHAPAAAESHHLINRATLATMKAGVRIVNCARGSLVDHDALLDALVSGHVAGAGLDVTEPEPLPAGHPLLNHPKVIVTPHIASSTVVGRRRLYEHAIDNALAVLEGRPASIVPVPGFSARGGAT